MLLLQFYGMIFITAVNCTQVVPIMNHLYAYCQGDYYECCFFSFTEKWNCIFDWYHDFASGHRYQSLPIINDDGKYAGVVTEGDLLWAFKNRPGFSFTDAEKMMLSDIPRHFHYETVAIDQTMDSLIDASYRQSFVPVIDDNETFIGLIKRSDIIRYFYRRYQQLQN